MVNEIRSRLADKARWLAVGTFSEQEYQEQLRRSRALEGYRAHANDLMTKIPIVGRCTCSLNSHGCPKCDPGAYAGGGYFSNDPSVTS